MESAEHPATASDLGAGRMGFAGTARETPVVPAGLTTVAGPSLDDSPSLPLLPSSWGPETEEGTTGQGDGASGD